MELYKMTNEELCREIHNGNKSAMNELINKNKGLVVSKARSVYQSCGLERWPHMITMDDIVQEGNIALYRAALLFNKDKGCLFSTYAGRAIYNNMISLVRDIEETFDFKYVMGEDKNKKRNSKNSEASSNDDAYDEESEAKRGVIVSIDECVETEDGYVSQADSVDDRSQPGVEDLVIKKLIAEDLASAVNSLPERQFEYGCYRFGLGKVAEDHSINKTRQYYNLSRGKAMQDEKIMKSHLRKQIEKWM